MKIRFSCFSRALSACMALLLAMPAEGGAAMLPQVLGRSAQISLRATDGLFTSVARAGTRLIAVGERGRIVVSDDNGRSWRQVEVPTSVTLTGVAFATDKDGWAIGQMGVILKTDDGGDSWSRVLDGVRANELLLSAANSAQQQKGANANSAANLLAAKQFVAGGPSVPFLCIMPLSPNNIIAAGGFGMAFESHDGGRSWASIFDQIPNPNGLNIYSLLQMQGALYFIGEQGLVERRNAGGTYKQITTPFQGTFFGGLAIHNDTLLLYGLQGTVMRSEDAGKDWNPVTTDVSAGIDVGFVLTNGTIILGDLAGDLLSSKDNGKSFVLTSAGEPVAGLAQAADGTIIVAGPLGLRRISNVGHDSGV